MLGIADALEANQKLIAFENEADIAAAQQAGYESSLIARLALKPGKVWNLDFLYSKWCLDQLLFLFLFLFFSTIS